MARIVRKDIHGNILVEEDNKQTQIYGKSAIGLDFDENPQRPGLIAYYYTERGTVIVFMHRSFSEKCQVPGTYFIHPPIDERGRLFIRSNVLIVLPEEAVEEAEEVLKPND